MIEFQTLILDSSEWINVHGPDLILGQLGECSSNHNTDVGIKWSFRQVLF